MKKKWIRQALTLLLISILVFEPVPSSALRISPVLSAAAEEKDEDSEAEKEAKIALAQGEAESIRLVYEAQAQGLEKLREAHIDESVLRLKGLEALRDVADGRATKIYMPTDISKVVSTLGVVSESLGIGDSTPVDKTENPAKKQEADPCINEETSKEGRKAADTGDSIRVDVETRRTVI